MAVADHQVDVHVRNVVVAPSVFYGIALSLAILRSFVRIRSRKFGWDDYFMLWAITLLTCLFGLGIEMVDRGMGRHSADLSLDDRMAVGKLMIFCAQAWMWGVTCVKLSVLLTLYRIEGDSRVWRRSLQVLMALIFTMAIAAMFIDWLQCRPIRALWDPRLPRNLCMSRTVYRHWLTGFSCFVLVTDVIISLLPLTFIIQLQRPRFEKIALGILMTTGLFCTVVVSFKLVALHALGRSHDFSYYWSDVHLWSTLELCVGISSACVPPLKQTAEKGLRRLGLLSPHRGEPRHHGFVVMRGPAAPESDTESVRMSSLSKAETVVESIMPEGPGDEETAGKAAASEIELGELSMGEPWPQTWRSSWESTKPSPVVVSVPEPRIAAPVAIPIHKWKLERKDSETLGTIKLPLQSDCHCWRDVRSTGGRSPLASHPPAQSADNDT